MPEHVHLTVENRIGVVRLDRPPVNALNRAVREELIEVAAIVTAREDVRAVVVHGGPKTFAAGADVRELASTSHADMISESRRISAGIGALAHIRKPTVSAITGFALGGGLEIALATDRRIAADDARLGVPEILLGVIPGGGGTQRLARLVGEAAAKDLVYTGRFVGAAEALAMGLVDEVVPAGEVFDRAVAYAAQFAEGPARAYAAAKEAIEGGLDRDLEAGLDLESEVFAALFATEDRTIGMESFLEHGPGKARFTGR
ncbi:enoyl-CoA hydratase/isomerase family protein [Amycolatopsis thermophila]|uniref:Enoyl-CoA hydratase n=1 Tax=Amycolatopsis thermophila TaxID=206084 RepID=A0ABU0F0P0_9PSEU|nr:enoyl-CoA hydratase-related protein [Amycolatopsis thermophila]MDQ0381136.1 enoyl-CoA hydratase [Amycolatopsis thermophila]